MANAEAWAEGAAIGSERAKEHRDKKERLSDEELQGKISDLVESRKSIQGKLPLLLDDKGNPTPQYNDAIQQLTQNARDLREVYHPDKQPGAIEKFGHLLTDALHVTKPEDRIAKEGQKRATAAAGDEKTALGVAAAAPISPVQQGTQRGQGQAAEDLAVFNGKMKIYDQQNPRASSPDATPEEKQARQEYANSLLQGPSYGKEQLGKWDRILGKVNGKPATMLYNEKTGKYKTETEEDVSKETIDAFVPDQKAGKPGTSVFSVSLDTYAKSKGYDSFNDIPSEYKEAVKDYEIRKAVLDRTISKKSIVTKIMQDAEGHPFTATVTNYSGPAGNEELVDPMPMKQGAAPQSSGPTNATPNPAKTNPSSPNLDKVKKDAKALNTPSAGGGNATYGAPNTSVQMKTPGITKLGEQHDAAVELVSEAQDAVANPNNGEMQFLLVDNLLHGALGRVNEIEIKRIQDRGGWFLAPERWEAEAKSGTMAPQLVKQLYDFTLSQQKAIEKAQATHGNPTDVKNQANKTQWPKAPDIGTVEDGDDGKHKYIGGDPTKKESWQKVTQ